MKDAKVYQVSDFEKKVVSKNGRVIRLIKYNGETKTIAEWSDITGIPYATLQSRLDDMLAGMTVDDIFSKRHWRHLKRDLRKKGIITYAKHIPVRDTPK